MVELVLLKRFSISSYDYAYAYAYACVYCKYYYIIYMASYDKANTTKTHEEPKIWWKSFSTYSMKVIDKFYFVCLTFPKNFAGRCRWRPERKRIL